MLINRKLKAPFKPTINQNDPTENFDEEYLNLDINNSPVADWISDCKDTFDCFDKVEYDDD